MNEPWVLWLAATVGWTLLRLGVDYDRRQRGRLQKREEQEAKPQVEPKEPGKVLRGRW